MTGSKGLVAVLVGALAAAPVAAQSLGDAAAKERERRKGKNQGKVYTDADIKTAPAEADATVAAEGATAAGVAGEGGGEAATRPPADPEAVRAEEQRAWQADLDRATAALTRLDAEIARLEGEANDTRGYLYGNRRTAALDDLERARRDRESAQQKLDDLVESGRRRGFRAP